jgi:hypothetical protein
MHGRTGRQSGRWGVCGLALVAVTIITLASVATAWAAPPANQISESDLATLLQSGPATGYFETVLGGATLASQTPVQIPVTVQSIVPNAGPAGDLILFEASGADIDKIGGIAEGMSGSPLYVDVGSSTFKLAGAVSYGDIFTTHNLGLATPIADMTALESTWFSGLGASPFRLRTPIATSTGTVGKVVVASSRAAAVKLPAAAGTAVMAPLTALQVNGLIPGSPVYKKLATRLAALGFDLTPRSAGRALGLPPLPALQGGSSLGVMYSDGDFAAGGLGTVTYVDPDNNVLVAFGHPFDYFGAVSLDLTSAWVQGIWSDLDTPYKVMSPVDVVGEISQDRGAGVAGLLGAGPVEVPMTSSATLGVATRTSASTATQAVVDSPFLAGLPSAAAAVAMQRVTDTGSFPGSATATATINLTDGTSEYQIQRTDLWTDPFDVMSVATGDIDNALAILTSGLPGLSPKVESIDFNATLSATDRSATIEDVTAPGGLKTGDNALTVTLLGATGQTVQVPATLTIPRGTSTAGTIDVFSATGGSSGGGGFGAPTSGASAGVRRAAADAAPTLAEVVAEINAAPKNTDLDIVYSPDNQGAVIQPIEVLADAQDWVPSGEVVKTTGQLQLFVPKVLDYNSPLFLMGMIGQADASTTVRVYERPSGLSNKLVATLPAMLANDGSASFDTVLPGLKTTTRLTVVWDGDADNLAATAAATIAVRARVSLSASVHQVAGRSVVQFGAHLTPAQVSGRVFIQYLAGKRWVRIANLSAGGALAGTWRPGPGSYKLRAVFGGSSRNAASTSGAVRVNVP